MKSIAYESQAGQDRFVHAVLGDGPGNTFLDIGMNDPRVKSNTYALEMHLGWSGLLLDSDEFCCRVLYPASGRGAPCLWGDATKQDWPAILPPPMQNEISYLSLDVDENTLAVLRTLPPRLRFKVITIEHDAYRFGPGPRDAMRAILQMEQGYRLVASNVRDQSMPFEDWWVNPRRLHEAAYRPFISESAEWQTIIDKKP